MSNRIAYTVNSRSLIFDVIDTEQVHEEVLVDEVSNYICKEVTCRWVLTLNPATTSVRRAGATLNVVPGEMGFDTKGAIEFHMSQPRGRLIWTVGGEVQLRSPGLNLRSDARNGPVPKVLAIREVPGTGRTLELVWEVTTWLPLTERFAASAPIMLSHTWEQTETLSAAAGYLAVRVTRGRAVFDKSQLPANITPDSFRPWLLPKCPGGFQRADISVTAEASGTQLIYQVVDAEQRIGYRTPEVCKAECTQSVDILTPDMGATITDGLQAIGSMQERRVAAQAAAAGGRSFNTTGLAIANTLTIARAVSNLIPKSVYNVTARVWGNKNASMTVLTTKAMRIIEHRFRTGVFGFLKIATYASAFHILHDPVSGMVEVTRTRISGVVAGGADNTESRALVFMANVGDDLDPITATKIPSGHPFNASAQATDFGSNLPPAGNGTRGYTLARILSQQLAGFAEKPQEPRLLSSNPIPANPHE